MFMMNSRYLRQGGKNSKCEGNECGEEEVHHDKSQTMIIRDKSSSDAVQRYMCKRDEKLTLSGCQAISFIPCLPPIVIPAPEPA